VLRQLVDDESRRRFAASPDEFHRRCERLIQQASEG